MLKWCLHNATDRIEHIHIVITGQSTLQMRFKHAYVSDGKKIFRE